MLAAVGLFIPAMFAASGAETAGRTGRGVRPRRVVLMVGYVLSLVWQFTNPERTLGGHEDSEGHGGPGLVDARSRSACCS